ncbi:hypothetical protein M5K25_017402 [Dendrobium thyrsiflorum]|uniref:Uncharacterized protein n=1 Tax=Dendrobium thyrsiflorum TaxID=117978 RepID=A0ABD0UMY8_DENTH
MGDLITGSNGNLWCLIGQAGVEHGRDGVAKERCLVHLRDVGNHGAEGVEPLIELLASHALGFHVVERLLTAVGWLAPALLRPLLGSAALVLSTSRTEASRSELSESWVVAKGFEWPGETKESMPSSLFADFFFLFSLERNPLLAGAGEEFL